MVVSGGQGDKAVRVEGWFIATPAAAVDRLYRYASPAKDCNPRTLYELVSGHNEVEEDPGTSQRNCLLDVEGMAPPRLRTFEDARGHLLTAQPEARRSPTLTDRCKVIE